MAADFIFTDTGGITMTGVLAITGTGAALSLGGVSTTGIDTEITEDSSNLITSGAIASLGLKVVNGKLCVVYTV